VPAYPTRAAFDDFVAGRNLRKYVDPARLEHLERRLLATAERRRSPSIGSGAHA